MNVILKNRIAVSLLLIFCFVNCFSQFIYESQLDQLKESVKHLLTNNKNISRVPHDCSDRPFVEIDLVFKEDNINGSKYFAVYANKSYYVEINGFSRDHLPLIHRDIQPKPVDSRFQRRMAGKQPISQYKFVGPLYLYKIPSQKEPNKYILVGFNQVWLGCPQPLCISPGFDGLLSLSSMTGSIYHSFRGHRNTVVMFRGNYFWYYDFTVDKPPNHPPLTDTAARVEERWVDRKAYSYPHYGHHRDRDRDASKPYLNDSMVVPTYIDAVVPGVNKYNNCLYFFKNDEFVCYEWYSSISVPMKIANSWKSSDERWKSAKIDAAFHIKTLIYFIAEDQLWCFTSDRISCHSYPKNLRDLHRDFPLNITTAFVHKEYIFVIKGSLYYKISVAKFPMKIGDEEMRGQYLFQDLLGCDEGLYTAWGFHSYDNFIETIAKRLQTGLEYSKYESLHSESNAGLTFAIICLTLLTISSVLLLVVWYLRPHLITELIQRIKSPFK